MGLYNFWRFDDCNVCGWYYWACVCVEMMLLSCVWKLERNKSSFYCQEERECFCLAKESDRKIKWERERVLCISTSKWVLRTLFVGQNQFFDAKTTLCVLLRHKMYKIMQKITKNNVIKSPKCYFTLLLLHVLHDFVWLSFNFLFILFR